MENQEGTLTELFAPASTAPPTYTVLPITTAAQFEIKSATINMLPEFYAFESEQPYIRLNKFLKICQTFKNQNLYEALSDKAQQPPSTLPPLVGRPNTSLSRQHFKTRSSPNQLELDQELGHVTRPILMGKLHFSTLMPWFLPFFLFLLGFTGASSPPLL